MSRLLIALLVTCALTAAMVPKQRLAKNVEEVSESSEPKICAPTTPCGWRFYNPVTRQVTLNVTNTFCICQPGQACYIEYVDDSNTYAFTYTCANETAADSYDS